MRKFIAIIALVLISAITFGQNYKEGDFSGKQVKGKSIKLDNEWVISKTSADVMELKYQNTLVAQLSSTGALTVTGITNTGATTSTNLTLTGTIDVGTSVADTAKFGTDANGARNKYIRKKITGVTATDRFMVIPIMATGVAIPGTAEFLGYYCTTDSLVISRNTASTAGMAVTYIRLK